MPVVEHLFDSRDAMLVELENYVINSLITALQGSNAASLLVSGGSTPAPLYRKLASANLNWASVQVALVDERWVNADSDSSNERMLKETLLQGAASDAQFVSMKSDEDSPFSAVDNCNKAYDQLQKPYTLCLLGMGKDGHTASLFPEAIGLEHALASTQSCAPIEAKASEVTGPNLLRMTMTPTAILSSEKIVLLITGEDKWQIYRQALESQDFQRTPVAAILSSTEKIIDVFWAP